MARLTLDELHESWEFKSLTEKQQKFVDTYLTNGEDPLAATMASYECKDKKTAQVLTSQMMSNHKVLFVMSIFYNDDPTNFFLRALWRMIYTGKVDAKLLQAMRLYAVVRGWARSGGKDKIPYIGEIGIPSTPPEDKQPEAVTVPEEQQQAEVASFLDKFDLSE